MAITLNDNEFFTGLANLALFLKLYATNTSSEPASFVDKFATETLPNGDTKLFPFSDLPTVADYSPTSSLLTVTKVNTNEEKISINTRKVVKSSYNRYILDMAFTSDSGMNYFIGYLLGQMESAKTDYMYDVIVADLFGKTYTGDQLKEVSLIDTSVIADYSQLNNAEIINQKRIANTIEKTIQNMEVFSDKYNAIGYKQALDRGDLRMVIVAPYENEQVLNLYASLLKSEYIEKSFKKPEKLVIPEIKIPENNEDVICFIMHKYHYQYFYKFVFMGTFFDVSNLTVNNFLHFWYGKGFLDNLPCVKIKVQ